MPGSSTQNNKNALPCNTHPLSTSRAQHGTLTKLQLDLNITFLVQPHSLHHHQAVRRFLDTTPSYNEFYLPRRYRRHKRIIIPILIFTNLRPNPESYLLVI